MEELLFIIDYIIIFLLIGLVITIIFQILPHSYRLYKKADGITNSDEYSRYGYFSEKKFWKWIRTQQSWMTIYRHSKNHKEVYYNNFKLFQILWKTAIVLLTFRVLVMFFGPY